MDFLTRTCFAGGPSAGPGHGGPVNLGTEGLDDTVQVAVTENADRAWRTVRPPNRGLGVSAQDYEWALFLRRLKKFSSTVVFSILRWYSFRAWEQTR